MAAQLVAAHNAAMECYRRAMIGEQTFEGRRENLAQANKLSRTYTTLLEALNRHRGKGQQKVTVEHVHVHSGGQAVVGVVGGDRAKLEDQAHAIANAPQPANPELLPGVDIARRPIVQECHECLHDHHGDHRGRHGRQALCIVGKQRGPFRRGVVSKPERVLAEHGTGLELFECEHLHA